MTHEEITALLDSSQINIETLTNQELYYKGKNPTLFEPLPKPHPDNRVPVPFARRFVDLTTGFVAKPGNITYSGDSMTTLQPIFSENEEELITMNEFKNACKHGRAFELHWLEGTEPKFYQLPISQCYPVYSSDLKPRLIAFAWVRKIGKEEVMTYFDSAVVQEYRKFDSRWTMVSEAQNLYGQVPVLELLGNENRENLFDHITPLQDFFDRLISQDLANEADKFAGSYLLMGDRIDTTVDENGMSSLDKIKQSKTFEGLDPTGTGDVRGKVAYLVKDIPTNFLQLSIETVSALIYEMANMFNPNDDAFATASGVAQKYKMLAFKYMTDERSAYLIRFLQDRIRLIARVLANLGRPVAGDPTQVTIRIIENLPSNMLEIGQTAAQVKGIVSDEKLLDLFPADFIGDKEAEMERLAAQAESSGIVTGGIV